jgi:hypothetical protein
MASSNEPSFAHTSKNPGRDHCRPSVDGRSARGLSLFRAALHAIGALLLLFAVGCAKGEVSSGQGTIGGAVSGAGGTMQITLGTSPASDAAAPTQALVCDSGDACACPPINVAVLGKPGKWGPVKGADTDTALQDWLNGNSAGSARVDNFTERKTLTSDFLATYNVIILQSLSEDSDVGPWWSYGADEAAAFQSWIEGGGGVISLIGYSSGDEISPVNQLLQFSGVTYNNDGVWGECADSQVCTCTGSNTLSDWVRTDPVIAKVSTGVTFVGFQNGRSINAPTDGHVAATIDGKPVLVGKLAGKGRVLAFGDEWITYTSQWTGAGNPKATDPSCQGNLPQDKYQMAQFWYNMIRWAQPNSDCFTIVDSSPVTIW